MTKLILTPKRPPPSLVDLPDGTLVVVDGSLLLKVRSTPPCPGSEARPVATFFVVLPSEETGPGGLRSPGWRPAGTRVLVSDEAVFFVPSEVEVRP